MQDNKPSGVRITVERITVTTVRSRDHSEKVYCNNCKAQMESGDLDGQRLLASGKPEANVVDPIAALKANNG